MLTRTPENSDRAPKRRWLGPLVVTALPLILVAAVLLWAANHAVTEVLEYRGDNQAWIEAREQIAALADYPVAATERTFTSNFQDPDPEFPTLIVEVREKKLGDLLEKSAQTPAGESPAHASVKAALSAQGIDGIPDSGTPIKLSLHGDEPSEWLFPKKSWRIEFLDESIGTQSALLANPKSPDMLGGVVANWLGRRLGVIAPDVEMVSLYLNKEFHGVYVLTEQTDACFLQRHTLPEGNVYADSGEWPDLLYKDVQAWSKVSSFEGKPEHDYQDLDAFLTLVQHPEDDVFEQHIEEILDVEATLRWHAITEFFQGSAADRWYSDPSDGRLRPILSAVDVFSRPSDSLAPTHPVVLRLIEFPAYCAVYDRIRAQLSDDAVEAELLAHFDRMVTTIRPQVKRDKNKAFQMAPSQRTPFSNRRFDESVATLRDAIVARFATWRDEFESESRALTTLRKNTNGYTLEIKVPRAWVVDVHDIGIDTASTDAVIEWRVYYDANDDHEWDTTDPLYGFALSEGPHTDVRGRMSIRPTSGTTGLSGLRTERLFLIPSRECVVSTLEFGAHRRVGSRTSPIRTSFKSVSEHRWNDRSPTVQTVPSTGSDDKRVVWGPGLVHVEFDHQVPSGTTIEVAAGTTVRFEPGVSVLSRGRILARGTAEAPIHFIANESRPWGVLALVGDGASGSLFEHCHFSDGSEARLEGVTYTGMLAIHHADANLRDCTFARASGDDGLNCKFWEGVIERCRFEDNGFDAIDLDYSGGIVRDTLVLRSGNDGIDLGSSFSRIERVRVQDSGDKGLSFGERSRPLVVNCEIQNNKVGIAVKDLSEVEVVHCSVTDNNIGAALYQKKEVFGGGYLHVANSVIASNGLPFAADSVSQVRIDHSFVDDCRANAHVQLGEGVHIKGDVEFQRVRADGGDAQLTRTVFDRTVDVSPIGIMDQ